MSAIKNNTYTRILSIVGVGVGVTNKKFEIFESKTAPVSNFEFLFRRAYVYTYDARNLCVGVIFDFKQDGRFFFKFERFGVLRNKI